MKFPWSRKPVDLVASQLAELEARRVDEPRSPLVDSLIAHANTQIRADGGWCAPSDVFYSLPEMQVSRGGLRVPAPTDDAWIRAGQGR